MATGDPLEYMYLVFARDRYYEVAVDGNTTRVAADTPDSALQSYYREHIHPQVESAVAEWHKAFTAFKQGTESERFEVKEGSLGSRYRVTMVRLTFPDGSSTECREHEREARTDETFRRIRGAVPDAWQFPKWGFPAGSGGQGAAGLDRHRLPP